MFTLDGPMKCLTMTAQSFILLLGPLKEIMNRKVESINKINENLNLEKAGSSLSMLAIGGIFPFSIALIATASSIPAPIAWPVNPFVLIIVIE